jgi:hypothetical protein
MENENDIRHERHCKRLSTAGKPSPITCPPIHFKHSVPLTDTYFEWQVKRVALDSERFTY